ncbi:MAG: hypothetical protein SGJ24_02160 [Chloroflexota bacterium]|nr:hypothetical protein [Chloroflexota bacterium]
MRNSILLPIAALLIGACSTSPDGVQPVTPLPPTDSAAAALVVSATPTLAATSTVAPTVRAVNLNPTAQTGVMATIAPVTTSLPPGEARAIAAATDIALHPTARSPIAFDGEPVAIEFDEFYEGYNLRYGLMLSDKLVSLDGRSTLMEGYMAPPLKPELDYFVLTRVKLAFCPFCSTAADWPDDIALVYMPEGQTTVSTGLPVRIVGRMEIGQSVDSETGMVSLVRIYADNVETIN